MRGAEVDLLTLAPATEEPLTLPRGVHLRPIKVVEDNYLARAIAFREGVGRALYALKPDIVHFRGPFEGQAAIRYAADRRIPTIFEVNGLPSVELRYHHPAVGAAPAFEGKLRATEQFLLNQATLILTQSNATRRFLALRAQTPIAAPIVVVPNGADPALLTLPRRSLDTATALPRPPRLLYVGSLAPWQGLGELLSAVARLRKHRDFRLEIIGQARREWERRLARAIRAFKLREHVVVREPVGPERLKEALRDSDICIAPLRHDRRNRLQGCSPIKIFEYKAAGRAIVASDLPCIQEILTHGEDGWLAKPSSPHRLRDALAHLLEHTELVDQLGARARRSVEESATWPHRQAAVASAYAALLASRA
ncbi:MAG: glycosyltransferase family 4 protein [Deltaproteobacteria bacterium]|nr:glycosyltransferase family 4 protein [Deltaproteobacteria bacterium]